MPVEVGQMAPNFTLYTHEAEPVTLSDYRGQSVLLLFFPGAFSDVCTTELKGANEKWPDGREEVQVFGISTDSTVVLNTFREMNDLRFPLLSDHDAEVSAAYGAKYDGDFTHMNLSRVSKRAAFVVDADGVVRYTEVLDDADAMPDFEAIASMLNQL